MPGFVFGDFMYTDGRPGPTVRASITLLPNVERARRTDNIVRWRPNHNFGHPDGRSFYVGQVEIDSGEIIAPGETRIALVRFIDGPGLRDNLVPGRLWRIQEGPNLVATATILEVPDGTSLALERTRGVASLGIGGIR
jgi:hypothetical protein